MPPAMGAPVSGPQIPAQRTSRASREGANHGTVRPQDLYHRPPRRIQKRDARTRGRDDRHLDSAWIPSAHRQTGQRRIERANGGNHVPARAHLEHARQPLGEKGISIHRFPERDARLAQAARFGEKRSEVESRDREARLLGERVAIRLLGLGAPPLRAQKVAIVGADPGESGLDGESAPIERVDRAGRPTRALICLRERAKPIGMSRIAAHGQLEGMDRRVGSPELLVRDAEEEERVVARGRLRERALQVSSRIGQRASIVGLRRVDDLANSLVDLRISA